MTPDVEFGDHKSSIIAGTQTVSVDETYSLSISMFTYLMQCEIIRNIVLPLSATQTPTSTNSGGKQGGDSMLFAQVQQVQHVQQQHKPGLSKTPHPRGLSKCDRAQRANIQVSIELRNNLDYTKCDENVRFYWTHETTSNEYNHKKVIRQSELMLETPVFPKDNIHVFNECYEFEISVPLNKMTKNKNNKNKKSK